jgi:OPA family glycerol-3-phosphate transporter-like MFS transporter
MVPNYFYPVTVALCLAAIIAAYFFNNPLGMTYAFLYMGRYNLNVSKNALGTLMSNEDFGLIFAVGTVTYAASFLINGPLIDKKLGGKNGILIATLGASSANILLGVLTWLIVARGLKINVVAAFSFLYSVNMYFQSYGVVSIIKVKSYWFHVREREIFGAIFGTLISIGVYFAFDWGQAIVEMTKANQTGRQIGFLI